MKAGAPPLTSKRLLDQIRERARCLHYSLDIKKAYFYCVRFFVRRHGLRHPLDMAATEVEAFLTMQAGAPTAQTEAAAMLADITRLEYSFCSYNNHAYFV